MSDLNAEWSERPLQMPQQRDSHSCGVLTLMAAKTIIKETSVGEINITDVAMYRRYIKSRIVRSCRSDPDHKCRYAFLQRSENLDDRIYLMRSVRTLVSSNLRSSGKWSARSVHLCDLPVQRVNRRRLITFTNDVILFSISLITFQPVMFTIIFYKY